MILKREVLAAEARRLIDMHDDWDSLHCIVTLHPDGEGGLRPGMYVAVDPAVDPGSYPGLIARAAAEMQAKEPGDPAYAYAFQGEFFGMREPPPGAPAEERERFRRARMTRTFHEQPEAVECATAWVADIHGRAWQCSKRRDTGEVRESFRAPGVTAGGAIVDALVRTARATGAAAWGAVPHAGGLN